MIQDIDESVVRVESRFKNARLYNAIEERSVPLKAGTHKIAIHKNGPIKAWCELHGLSHPHVYLLLNLQRSPVSARSGEYLPFCVTIAALLDRDVDWLFPRDLYAIKWPTVAVKEIGHGQMIALQAMTREQRALPPTQEQDIARREFKDLVAKTLHTLSPREEQVIKLRFGIGNGGVEHTHGDVGQVLGVSSTRSQQIEATALRKMRHPSRSRPLANLREFLP